jgi:signal transduction histidine kinase
VLPLYAWLRRHPMLVDGVLACFVALIGTVMGVRDASRYGLWTLPLWGGMVVPIVFRRRHPVTAFCTVVAVGALEVGLLPRPSGSDLLAVLIMLYTLAAYRPRRISVPGLLACLVGSAVAVLVWVPWHSRGGGVFQAAAVSALFFGPALLAWVLGDSMRWRRGFYSALEERAARLEAERDAQAQIAAAAERARIARELHDVVAHNVSVMVVQADGAGYALQEHPERVREALEAISRTGRSALAEMRHMLGVLRTAGDDRASLTPQPGMEQITELLAHSREAGLPVSFAVEGVPRALPPGVSLAAYRVIQESLTNTRKHGGLGVSAAVTMRFCEDGLTIVVRDDGRGAAAAGDGAGHGLVGMRERVEMYGGTVSAGPDTTGYTVMCVIPFPSGPSGSAGSSGAVPPAGIAVG